MNSTHSQKNSKLFITSIKNQDGAVLVISNEDYDIYAILSKK